jgi:type II secretory pathway component PulM
MSTILHEPNAEETAQLQYVIDQYLEEMRGLNSIMEADQVQIETLRAETRVIASQTRVFMASLRETLAKLEAS